MRQAFVKIEFSQKGKCLVVSVKSEQNISESQTFNSHLLGQDSQSPSVAESTVTNSLSTDPVLDPSCFSHQHADFEEVSYYPYTLV